MSTTITTPTAAPATTIPFLRGIGVVLSLELRQRVRGTAWYVLLGIFVGLIALVTFALAFAFNAFGVTGRGSAGGGSAVFSAIVYFVLLLGTLVTPALSGNAINGDRDAGTLATTQVTLLGTWQLVLGKFLAAWVTALVFLVAAVPFLVFAVFLGDSSFDTVVVSVLVLAAELGVVAAIGVGLSGILNRPLFSIVVTYLVVAALSIGSLIAFTLAGLVTQTPVTTTYISLSYGSGYGEETGEVIEPVCLPPETSTSNTPRFDYYWPLLTLNPYVVLADASPTHYTPDGSVQDMFGMIKQGVRSAQIPPEAERVFDDCAGAIDSYGSDYPTSREVIEGTVPGWFVGLLLHLVLASAALVGAWSRTRTPAKTLPKGSRIA